MSVPPGLSLPGLPFGLVRLWWEHASLLGTMKTDRVTMRVP